MPVPIDPVKRIYSLTGLTAQKPKSKRRETNKDVRDSAREPRKKLTYQSIITPSINWSEEEDSALTQFVLLSSVGHCWPITKCPKLWEGASKFLHNTRGTARTSKEVVKLYYTETSES